jgi:ribosomal protein S21
MQVVRRDGESFDQLWRRFKQGVERSGLLRDIKRKRFHLSRGQTRRLKAKLAEVRQRRRRRREEAHAKRRRTSGRG